MSMTIDAFGVRAPLYSRAKSFGLNTETIRGRINRGWTAEDAITRPTHTGLEGGIYPAGEGTRENGGLVVSRPRGRRVSTAS